jgi:hypothetical protein
MKRTRCVISPLMKCTSRLSRSSLATTIEHLRRFALGHGGGELRPTL